MKTSCKEIAARVAVIEENIKQLDKKILEKLNVKDAPKIAIDRIIELSNAIHEPFGDLKEWLEHIVTKSGSFPEAGSIVQLDCEHYKVVLYYEPILYTEPGYRGHIFKNNKYGCGLFYIYNEAQKSITANTIIGTKDLVKSFYLSIINYAKEMQQNENFVENWVWDAYNSEMHDYDEDSPELKEFFLKKVRSKIIEEYLGIKE